MTPTTPITPWPALPRMGMLKALPAALLALQASLGHAATTLPFSQVTTGMIAQPGSTSGQVAPRMKSALIQQSVSPRPVFQAADLQGMVANVASQLHKHPAQAKAGAKIARFNGFTGGQQQVLHTLQKNARSAPVRMKFSGNTGTPTFIAGLEHYQPQSRSARAIPNATPNTTPNTTPAQRTQMLLQDLAPLFKLDNASEELQIRDTQQDALGYHHIHVQQTLNGIPVFGRELRVHENARKQIYAINGHTLPSVRAALTSPAISDTDAGLAALKHLGLDSNARYELTEPPHLVYFPDGKFLKLAYAFNIMLAEDKHWQYLVDAADASVLHRYTLVTNDIVAASGQDLLGVTRHFNSWETGGTYVMIDPSLPDANIPADPVNAPATLGDLYVFDMRNTQDQLFYTTSNSPTQWSPVAVSAMHNTLSVYNYYKNTHQRDSFDNNNASLLIGINMGQNFNNAFWNGKFMIYGNGDQQTFGEFARCLDVAAHEMTHGVVQYTANLIYENQSGALNESFADVFGAMVDRNDWLMGEDCFLGDPGYFRSFVNPASGYPAQPAHMNDYMNLPNDENHDAGGVHYNSGITNRAAYLIAEGLGQEGLGTSIGREKTEKIYYRALNNYLDATAQFIDARLALVQSAIDLYGEGSEAAAVRAAFDAVGIRDGNGGGSDPNPADPVAGDDYVMYLFPDDNGYLPYVYAFGSSFNGYEQSADKLVTSASYALQTRPAMATAEGKTFAFFVDSDNRLHMSDIAQLPDNSDASVIDTANIVRSMTISPDARLFAFTTTEYDNRIYLADLEKGGSPVEISIPPIDYSQDQSATNTVLFADGLNFNYKKSQLIFDVAHCMSLPDNPCDNNGGGYTFWTIGIYNLQSGTVNYPFVNQNPQIDIGFPSFSRTNDYVAALDLIDNRSGTAHSYTMLADFNSGELTQAMDNGEGLVMSVPSFWGDDSYLVYAGMNGSTQSTFRLPLQDWQPQAGADAQSINNYAAEMPIAHRAGSYDNRAPLVAESKLIDFATGAKKASVRIRNQQPYDVRIVSIAISNARFRHNGVNQTIARNGSYSFDVTLDDQPLTEQQTGNLVITTETGQTLTIGLSATPATGPRPGGGEDTPPSSGKGGGGGGALLPLELLALGSASLLARRQRTRRQKQRGLTSK